MLRGDDVPDNFCQIFLSTFAWLSQRVIWKWEDKIKLEHQQQPIPSNVKTMPWLPQQELLAHPRVRLVILHGDLLSKQEAVYHGVPAIFLPISSDQPINAQKRKRLHYSYKLGWVDRGGSLQRHSTHFEHPKVWNACIISIVSPAYMSPCIPRYNQRVKEVSALMRDHIVNPMDRAIYWIEYVVRHQGGAPHLRGASHDFFLPQRALVDVFLLLLVISLFMAYVTFRLCHICIFYLHSEKIGYWCKEKTKLSLFVTWFDPVFRISCFVHKPVCLNFQQFPDVHHTFCFVFFFMVVCQHLRFAHRI